MSTPRFLTTSLLRAGLAPARSHQQVLHFSFHKNLTMFYARVARSFAVKTGRQQRHFNSNVSDFLSNFSDYDIASLNNQFVAVADIAPEARASLFLRDPRDLVVSGYFYHRRGAEEWCHVTDPGAADLATVNGVVPPQLRPRESFAECLNRLSIEDGLRAEIAFRENHFRAMRDWMRAPDPLVLRYEDIIGQETDAFRRMAGHYGFSPVERRLWTWLARRHAAGRSTSSHIRNPQSGQWKEVFPETLAMWFNDTYRDLLSETGYL